jgi:hypothetical protein
MLTMKPRKNTEWGKTYALSKGLRNTKIQIIEPSQLLQTHI